LYTRGTRVEALVEDLAFIAVGREIMRGGRIQTEPNAMTPDEWDAMGRLNDAVLAVPGLAALDVILRGWRMRPRTDANKKEKKSGVGNRRRNEARPMHQ
jgi:hypothetical protein